jgi:hypothetical protein
MLPTGYNFNMKEKRAFQRRDVESAPGTLVIGDRTIAVVYDNISLIGARVRALGERLPPVGSLGTLRLDEEENQFVIQCKVVGLDDDIYRLKFSGIGDKSLENLLKLLGKLGGDEYNPTDDLPKLVLSIN